jgi:hypothetical protein
MFTVSLTEMPSDNVQFLAIWEYNGEIWSDVFRRIDEDTIELYSKYEDADDGWTEFDFNYALSDVNMLEYVILQK